MHIATVSFLSRLFMFLLAALAIFSGNLQMELH